MNNLFLRKYITNNGFNVAFFFLLFYIIHNYWTSPVTKDIDEIIPRGERVAYFVDSVVRLVWLTAN